MINTIVLFDDTDSDLGDYFKSCAENLTQSLQSHSTINVTVLSGKQCDRASIDIMLDTLNLDRFIFVAYSHGLEDALMAHGKAYVQAKQNSVKFKGSLFYTNACLTAQILGQELINEGCLAFVGYSKEVDVIVDEAVFQKMDNFGITMFLHKEECTIGEAVEAVKNELNRQIDANLMNPFLASILTETRGALKIYGNQNLRKEDFDI